ncbi:MAG TPA: NAD(P)H-dependent glycerol-3-phosphate dehydrogenase [Pseudonocardiaceae bacterium]|nr:NAD(P)H-dependent glycerol-3-phosphate dehydrogenase [Pseudonocardiaceae bacterium]
MTRQIHVCVLGAGSWGTTVASLAAANAHVTLWARRAELAAEIDETHVNSSYLPDLALPPDLCATSSLEDAVWPADVLVVAVPSHGFRATLEEAAKFVRPWIPIVSLSKGLERGTAKRMTEVVDDVLPGHPVGVLAGPNLAREVLAGYAAAAVIAMPDDQVARSLQGLFVNRVFRVYTSTDVLGCELGGALKNVIAIAAGMAEGLGVGDNTRAMVITRGLAEITRLGVAMGADPRTFAGLTGLGDLMATCMSPLSRNRTVGERLARGQTIEQITSDMKMVAEGVKTCRVVLELADRYGVDMPIVREVDGVVNEGHRATDAYRGLVRIAPTSEIHGVA